MENVSRNVLRARAPDVLWNISYLSHLISNVSRYVLSCLVRRDKDVPQGRASIEDRLVILELQNRYLQVMLSSLSLCPSSTSTSESEKKKEETKPKPKIQRKKSTILISGAVEHMGKGGRYLGGGFKTSWHVVRAGRFEWYKKKTDPKPKSFVFLRGFTIKLDEADDVCHPFTSREKHGIVMFK